MIHICTACGVANEIDDAPNAQTFRKPVEAVDEGTPTIARVHKAHAWYLNAMGLPSMTKPNIAEERLWFDFFRAGFTEQKLYDVFRYLKSRIKDKRRQEGALTLRNLINPIQFREDLNLQQMDLRKKTPPIGMSNDENAWPPTCMNCGKAMRYNVPRMGASGGFVHADTGSLTCDGQKQQGFGNPSPEAQAASARALQMLKDAKRDLL